MTERIADQIAGIAALDDPVRRGLYEYVVGQPDPVGRDEAAAGTGTTRENAAFHLDKLVAAGLLESSYRRLSGRTGTGAGRPSKLYRRSAREVAVTLPTRRYDVAAQVLAEAASTRGGTKTTDDIAAAARRFGATFGATANDRARRGRRTALQRLVSILDEAGFEPLEEPRGVVRLRNCPFQLVAQRSPDVVCGMNLALIDGILDGANIEDVKTVLDREPGRCCVMLTAADRASRRSKKP